ncbi:unnamed protein product [Chondrus crispus]|uniref:Uncharacterized protein n=1 Tax=Chondrus crispus TaxID=2769 RepID=R7QMG3_CHOCR|nr:unnamed protein product [Chondrus crispus]CDF38565.1 unnamed protein product [Chondrus crispus]|eukprot:XP_005718470.1 unnamed protein product [Chondrus crispus]
MITREFVQQLGVLFSFFVHCSTISRPPRIHLKLCARVANSYSHV